MALASPSVMLWVLACSVTAIGLPSATLCAVWTASSFVLWVEVGDSLTFATPLRTKTLDWTEVCGIEFEWENKAIPLVIVPLSLVVGQRCVAEITLADRRVLRGRIGRDDALILHDVLEKYPALDTHLARDLASPRAVMTTFVESLLAGDEVYAAQCLDFSHIESPLSVAESAACAAKLKELIDNVWYIDYEEIPDDSGCPSPYLLASGSDQPIDEDLAPLVDAIKISRDESTGFWRFDAETVDMIVNEFPFPKEDTLDDHAA